MTVPGKRSHADTDGAPGGAPGRHRPRTYIPRVSSTLPYPTTVLLPRPCPCVEVLVVGVCRFDPCPPSRSPTPVLRPGCRFRGAPGPGRVDGSGRSRSVTGVSPGSSVSKTIHRRYRHNGHRHVRGWVRYVLSDPDSVETDWGRGPSKGQRKTSVNDGQCTPLRVPGPRCLSYYPALPTPCVHRPPEPEPTRRVLQVSPLSRRQDR